MSSLSERIQNAKTKIGIYEDRMKTNQKILSECKIKLKEIYTNHKYEMMIKDLESNFPFLFNKEMIENIDSLDYSDVVKISNELEKSCNYLMDRVESELNED